jgi:hypothetical protein
MVHSAERIALAGRLALVTQTYFPAIDGAAVLNLAEDFCGFRRRGSRDHNRCTRSGRISDPTSYAHDGCAH